MGIGGAESNVAIALTRMEVPCTWASRVGDDAMGALVAQCLATATILGTAVCTVPGDWEGIPTKAELAAWSRSGSSVPAAVVR